MENKFSSLLGNTFILSFMKFFSIFLLFIASTFSYGQKIKFTDSTNQWKYIWEGANPDFFFYVNYSGFLGDTILSGNSYKILNTGASTLYYLANNIFVRDDTNQNKVFCKYCGDLSAPVILMNSYCMIII